MSRLESNIAVMRSICCTIANDTVFLHIPQIAIVVTDGKSRDTTATLQQAALLRSVGAVIFAVGVGTNLDMDELKGISGAEYPDRMFSKESFDALVELNDRLIETTCTGERQ